MDKLKEYCEGRLSAGDERMMRDFLAEHGNDADVSECLGKIFDDMGESDAAEGEKAYSKAAAALGIDRQETKKRLRMVSWLAGIAASVAVLLAGGATVMLVEMQSQPYGLRVLGKIVNVIADEKILDDAGKIDADRKAHFIELGKKVGTESLKLTFDAMRAQVRPSMVLNRSTRSTAAGEWKKLGDVPAEELKLMRAEDPELYRRLYKAEYGVDCPELN